MKRPQWWLALAVCLGVCLAPGAAAELRIQDLTGFRYADGIVEYQKIELPEPKPPKAGGITTGAVFVLGRYLPPPYEVTVEGVHLMINGVPCSGFQRLLQTEEERAEALRREVIIPVELNLLDLYQRTKWYEGRDAAEEKLDAALAGLTDFRVVRVDRRLAEAGELPCITVHLEHTVMGTYRVDVEGPEQEETWIRNYGFDIIRLKGIELKKGRGLDTSSVGEPLVAFARAQPWVKSFDLVDGDIYRWRVNGRSFSPDYQPPDPEAHRWTIAELEQKAHETALNDTKPRVEAALRAGKPVMCWPAGPLLCDEFQILQLIRQVNASTCDTHERRKRLVNLLKPVLGAEAEASYIAEFIAVFWAEMGSDR